MAWLPNFSHICTYVASCHSDNGPLQSRLYGSMEDMGWKGIRQDMAQVRIGQK